MKTRFRAVQQLVYRVRRVFRPFPFDLACCWIDHVHHVPAFRANHFRAAVMPLQSLTMPPRARLDPESLLSAYSQGAFPMADHDGAIKWYTADPRGILPLESFHLPKTLRATVRQRRFDIHINRDFRATMTACMECHTEGKWINAALIDAYTRLHELGFAHSVEAWQDDELAGGLYGVSLGAAFFGESMFFRKTDASKVALAHLVQRLRDRNFELLDTQAVTTHLRRFGCINIPAAQYLERLRAAIAKPRNFV
jgi:leucyl/phenylalanyl-tRNA--protein transferase